MTLWALTVTDSKQKVLACSRLRPSTTHITNGRYVIHLRKSGLMSLLGSQQLQKIMLLLQMAGRHTAKNKTWSQLSAVVSTMGMLRLPPSHPHVISALLQRGTRAGGRNKSRKLLATSVLPHPPAVTSMPFIFLSHFG